MKQAFLITAYRDFDWLRKTVQIYAEGGIDCFIHVDRKSKIPREFAEWAAGEKGVWLYSRYRIKWGSYRHVSAVLYLMKQAVAIGNYDYLHIVSGNSFVTRPLAQVRAFFEENRETNYIQVDDLEVEDVDRVIDPWFIYWHFLHLYDKKTKFGNNFDYYFLKVQSRLGIRRKIRYRYHGLFYSHFSRAFVDYALNYIQKNPGYFRNLKTCNISEEFFFQNMIMDSPFRDTVEDCSLVYNVWNGGGVAQFLTMKDYEPMKRDPWLFARKFGQGSEELFAQLCKSMGEPETEVRFDTEKGRRLKDKSFTHRVCACAASTNSGMRKKLRRNEVKNKTTKKRTGEKNTGTTAQGSVQSTI